MSSRYPGYGDGIAQFDCNASDYYQQWMFLGNGDDIYQVRNRGQSMKCLQPENASHAGGVRLVIGSCNGTGPSSPTSWVFSR